MTRTKSTQGASMAKLAWAGLAALTMAAGTLGYLATAGTKPQQQPPTLEATVQAMPTSTPEVIDSSYYEQHEWPTATPAVPTPQPVLPTATSRPLPTATQYYPTPEPTETPEPVATATPQHTPTPKPTPTPVLGLENILTEQQIAEYVKGWQSKQLITPELLNHLEAVNKSLYYRFTGNTFESSKFVTKLLTSEEYKALEGKPGGTIPNSTGTIGLMPDGSINVYAYSHLGESVAPLNVLVTLLHETANAEAQRQFGKQFGVTDLNKFYADVAQKYKLGDVSDLNISWIERESLQALYRAAGFHYFEEISAIKFNHTLTEAERKNIDDTVDAIVKSKHFNPQATLVAWYRALNNPETRESLQKTGRITSQQTIDLFNRYASEPQTREEWEQRIAEIVTAVRTAPQYAQQIKDAAKLSNRVADINVRMEFVYTP